jgi:hypothetical protein
MNIGYYPTFRLPDDLANADALRLLLRELWDYRYIELYEKREDGRAPGDLVEAVNNIITLLAEHTPAIGHQRLLFVGWALALAASPTIKGWAPDATSPQIVLDAVHAFLKEGRQVEIDVAALFPQKVSPPQALHEALDVFANLARTLNPAEVRPALLEIFDDCLEGYAVFPGSAGRRDLFNWMLVEVVPAAWSLRLPDAIYTLHWPWPPSTSA